VESRGSGLLLVLLLLAGASAAVLVAGDRRTPDSERFQRLVGGLGFGPALDLSGCAFGLDPRLDGSCSEESGPVPAGACFCPRHAESVLYYDPLTRGTPRPPEEEDAPPP
jgi:hypothetical protein